MAVRKRPHLVPIEQKALLILSLWKRPHPENLVMEALGCLLATAVYRSHERLIMEYFHRILP